MDPRRIHPSCKSLQSYENKSQNEFDWNQDEFQFIRKKVKTDSFFHDNRVCQQQPLCSDNNSQDQVDNMINANNIYQQEFDNLGACSFKTFSKIGIDKINPFNKNQSFQFSQNCRSSGKRRKKSLVLLSDQKSKNTHSKIKNKLMDFKKQQLYYGSSKQISRLQKKNSVDNTHLQQYLDKIRKRESSFSAIPVSSSNTFNTEVINEMIDFNIRDENQISEDCLKKMVERALIKNVKFHSNILIQPKQQGYTSKYFSAVKVYKLLDKDGFSIKGFYLQNQKIRIHLDFSLTNKQFEKKFVFKPQSSSNIQKLQIFYKSMKQKQKTIKQKGIKFQGQIYNEDIQEWEGIRLYISQMKQNDQGEKGNMEQIQNIDYGNMGINDWNGWNNGTYNGMNDNWAGSRDTQDENAISQWAEWIEKQKSKKKNSGEIEERSGQNLSSKRNGVS